MKLRKQKRNKYRPRVTAPELKTPVVEGDNQPDEEAGVSPVPVTPSPRSSQSADRLDELEDKTAEREQKKLDQDSIDAEKENTKHTEELTEILRQLLRGLKGTPGNTGGLSGATGGTPESGKPKSLGEALKGAMKKEKDLKVEGVKNRFSGAGLLGIAASVAGNGVIGNILGAGSDYLQTRREEKKKKEDFVGGFSTGTDIGRKIYQEHLEQNPGDVKGAEAAARKQGERYHAKHSNIESRIADLSEKESALKAKNSHFTLSEADTKELVGLKKKLKDSQKFNEELGSDNKSVLERRLDRMDLVSNHLIKRERSDLIVRQGIIEKGMKDWRTANPNATPELEKDVRKGVEEAADEQLKKLSEEQLQELRNILHAVERQDRNAQENKLEGEQGKPESSTSGKVKPEASGDGKGGSILDMVKGGGKNLLSKVTKMIPGGALGAAALGSLPMLALGGATLLANKAMENPKEALKHIPGAPEKAKADMSEVEKIESQGSSFLGIESNEFKSYRKKYQESKEMGTRYSPAQAEAIKKRFGVDVLVEESPQAEKAAIEAPKVSEGTKIPPSPETPATAAASVTPTVESPTVKTGEVLKTEPVPGKTVAKPERSMGNMQLMAQAVKEKASKVEDLQRQPETNQTNVVNAPTNVITTNNNTQVNRRPVRNQEPSISTSLRRSFI